MNVAINELLLKRNTTLLPREKASQVFLLRSQMIFVLSGQLPCNISMEACAVYNTLCSLRF